MPAVCKLWLNENLKAKPASRWTKLTNIYNLRNVYQTKDIQPWSAECVQVWLIEKSVNCALALTVVTVLWKTLIAIWQTKLFSTRTLSAFPCCGCLRISSSWICWDDCWPVSESGTENILVSDSSSESLRPWWFFVAGKDSSRRSSKLMLNSLIDFSRGQNCWRQLELNLSSWAAKKETVVKLGRPL